MNKYRYILLFVNALTGAHYFFDREEKIMRFSPNAISPTHYIDLYSRRTTMAEAITQMQLGSFKDMRPVVGGLEFCTLLGLREGVQIVMERNYPLNEQLCRGFALAGSAEEFYKKMAEIFPGELLLAILP